MRASIGFIFCCSLVLASGKSDGIPRDSLSTILLKDSNSTKTVPLSNEKTTTIKSTTISSKVSNVTTATSTATTSSPAVKSTTIAPFVVNAPVPTPVPDPITGKWWVSNPTNTTTIVVRMAGQINIVFNVTNEQAINKKINIPSESNATKVEGIFNKNNETIKISWNASNSSGENFVALHFNKDELKGIYNLGNVEVSIDASELPPLNSTLKLVHSKEHFNTTVGHSYRCVKLQHFNLNKPEDTTQVVGQFEVTDFQFQAFKNDDKSNFGLAEDCAFDTSDVVPIAVGCVLAGLVVIVLAVYLISRRRSQARGYLSM